MCVASGAPQRGKRPMETGRLMLSAAASAFKHLVERDAAALRACLAGVGVTGDELRAVRPALEVRSALPTGEDDIGARLLAVAQHLQPAKAWHLVHLSGALLPALLEARRHRCRRLDMKHADDHRRCSYSLVFYARPPRSSSALIL